jgi:hypothetical protein
MLQASRVSPEVEPIRIPVPTALPSIIKILDVIVALADNIVFRYLQKITQIVGGKYGKFSIHHHPSNGTQEYRIRGEVRSEFITILQNIPWAHAQTDNGSDVPATPYVLKPDLKHANPSQSGEHTIKRGNKAVRSHPADTELAEMFVLGNDH